MFYLASEWAALDSVARWEGECVEDGEETPCLTCLYQTWWGVLLLLLRWVCIPVIVCLKKRSYSYSWNMVIFYLSWLGFKSGLIWIALHKWQKKVKLCQIVLIYPTHSTKPLHESWYTDAVAGFTELETQRGFRELETLYPNCESVTRACRESGGGRLYIAPQKPERIHHVYQQSKALMWEERFAETLHPGAFEEAAA